MTFTKRISIERYKGEIAEECAGLIEGQTEDGDRWIIFMNAAGTPSIYWPQRDEDGTVHGVPVRMSGPTIASGRLAKLKEILASSG